MADNESSEIETRQWLRGRGRAGAQYDAVNEASDELSCAARAVAAGAKKNITYTQCEQLAYLWIV